MTRNINPEMTVPVHRHFFLCADFWLPLLLILISLPLFWFTDLDLSLQQSLFRNGEWFLADAPVFAFVYHWGNIPALLAALISLLGILLGYSKARLLPYRRIFIYLLLVLALGPGLLVNTILKDQWGRPRPRNLIEFGGEYRYERPLQIDPTSPGKSFPCGHATMGFYFIAVALLLRRNHPRLSLGLQFFALAYGGLIGWARMAQGGHFFSDVIWAGALIWLVSFALFRRLKLHRQLLMEVKAKPKALRKWQKLSFALLFLIVIFAVLLATPYKRKHAPALAALVDSLPGYSFKFEAAELEMDMSFSRQTTLEGLSNGFGAPGSKLSYSPELIADTPPQLLVRQKKRGVFTELESRVDLSLDSLSCQRVDLIIASLKGSLSLPSALQYFRLQAEELDLDLQFPTALAAKLYLAPGIDLDSSRTDLIIYRENPESCPFRIEAERGQLRLH